MVYVDPRANSKASQSTKVQSSPYERPAPRTRANEESQAGVERGQFLNRGASQAPPPEELQSKGLKANSNASGTEPPSFSFHAHAPEESSNSHTVERGQYSAYRLEASRTPTPPPMLDDETPRTSTSQFSGHHRPAVLVEVENRPPSRVGRSERGQYLSYHLEASRTPTPPPMFDDRTPRTSASQSSSGHHRPGVLGEVDNRLPSRVGRSEDPFSITQGKRSAREVEMADPDSDASSQSFLGHRRAAVPVRLESPLPSQGARSEDLSEFLNRGKRPAREVEMEDPDSDASWESGSSMYVDMDDDLSSDSLEGATPSTKVKEAPRPTYPSPLSPPKPSYSQVLQPRGTFSESNTNYSPAWKPSPSTRASESIQYRSPAPCVICHERPSYSKGGKSYPTCGLACASKLEERDRERKATYRSGQSSMSSSPGMCVVCGIKPKATNNAGRRFPTCGFKCSATLDPPKPGSLCDVCKRRPKLVQGGKTLDQCSIKCQEKAKAAMASASAGTCELCLSCWRTNVQKEKPYCSEACRFAMMNASPTLVEIPRGHVLFDEYNKKFQTGWDNISQGKPTAKHMFFTVEVRAIGDRYVAYRNAIRGSLETYCWVPVHRECNIGDSGSVNLCNSPACPLCDILRNAFIPHRFPNGLRACLSSAKAYEQAANIRQGPMKAMLYVQVAHGRLEEYTQQQLYQSSSRVRDVVSIVSYPNRGTRRPAGELHVNNLLAVLPVGVIIYS